MQVNVAGIRRNIKNLAHNYSDAQVKVREATSNDPWGPSATIMAEIADLTYNVVAFSEIMQMIWKRLNDHGKNWRHVYKALIVLEYLIKTGTEKVAQQCKENIFAIQTLKEFVYFEEGKDQGVHVREKAKHLVSLLKDDERLKNERTKALKAKERFAQHASGFGSDGYIEGPTHRETPTGWQDAEPKVSDMEFVRPQTAGEEELQLQLAMAMSREEAEQEEAKRRSDDVRLQLALSQSEQDFKKQTIPDKLLDGKPKQSHLMDLLDISLGATSISNSMQGAVGGGNTDPWGTPARAPSQLSDPWSRTSSPPVDPWQSVARPPVTVGAALPSAPPSVDGWAPHRTQSPSAASGSSTEGWLQNNSTPTGPLNGNGVGLDPWLPKTTPSSTPVADPWLGGKQDLTSGTEDPWQPKGLGQSKVDDPWTPSTTNLEQRPTPPGAISGFVQELDEFDAITNRNKTGSLNNSTSGSNNNNASLLDEMDPLSTKKSFKTPQAFLGENSSLVNLDNLIKPVVPNNVGSAAYNPFSDSTSATSAIPPKANLFQQQQQHTIPSINQLKQQPFPVNLSQDPWAPVNATNAPNQYHDYLIDYDSDQITVCTSNKNYNYRPGDKNMIHIMPDNGITGRLYNNNNYTGYNYIPCRENNNNMPWMKPEASASNPFLT